MFRRLTIRRSSHTLRRHQASQPYGLTFASGLSEVSSTYLLTPVVQFRVNLAWKGPIGGVLISMLFGTPVLSIQSDQQVFLIFASYTLHTPCQLGQLEL